MDVADAIKALFKGINVSKRGWSEGEYLTTSLDTYGNIKDENGGQYFLEIGNCNDIKEEWDIYLTDKELITRGKILTIFNECENNVCGKDKCQLFDKYCGKGKLLNIYMMLNWPEHEINEAYELMRKDMKLEEQLLIWK